MAAQQQSVQLTSLLMGDEFPDKKSGVGKTRRLKKKIAVVGPALDTLDSQPEWGSHLGSSSPENQPKNTIKPVAGLTIFLRQFSLVLENAAKENANFDFVIWRLSNKLKPSLLKRLLIGSSAVIVLMETQFLSISNFENKDDVVAASASGNFANKRLYLSDDDLKNCDLENSDLRAVITTVGDQEIDIEALDKYANQTKLPLAIIHLIKSDDTQDLDGGFGDAENQIVTLRETQHSLHLGLSKKREAHNLESCLDQALRYIAQYFVSVA